MIHLYFSFDEHDSALHSSLVNFTLYIILFSIPWLKSVIALKHCFISKDFLLKMCFNSFKKKNIYTSKYNQYPVTWKSPFFILNFTLLWIRIWFSARKRFSFNSKFATLFCTIPLFSFFYKILTNKKSNKTNVLSFCLTISMLTGLPFLTATSHVINFRPSGKSQSLVQKELYER